MELTPALILAMWTAGIAAGGSLVSWWQAVGPGYLWLTGGVVALSGAMLLLADGGTLAGVGIAVAVIAALLARYRTPATLGFALAAVLFGIGAVQDSPLFPVITGSLLLGGITTEMILGHWYLVDPRLPRRPLLTLDVLAAVGLVLDASYVFAVGEVPFSGSDAVFGLAYVMLAGFAGILMVGVWFSLKEPRYSGVMAATGLSYLAVLVGFGVVTVGRLLVVGPSS